MAADASAAVAAVDTQAIVELAKDLIRIPSFKGDESDCARFLVQYMKGRGFEADLQEVEPGRYNAIGRLKGAGGGKSLMFNGHMDIDPLARDWRRDPWTPVIEGDRLYGAGISNMKAGVASMIGAADAVRRSGTRLAGDIVITCVVGELQGGVGSAFVAKNGPRTDFCIVTEPYGADNIATAHAGWVQAAVHVLGRSAHISVMHEGIDAIRLGAKAVDALYATKFTYTPRRQLDGVPRILVGAAIGGQGREHDLKGPNYVCDFFTLLVDVRFDPSQTPESVGADLRRSLDELKAREPDFAYELEIPAPPHYRIAYEVMPPFDLPEDASILDAVKRAYREVTGKDPAYAGVPPNPSGVDDTGHFLKAGIPCLLYGPGGYYELPEAPDMYTSIAEMETAAKVLARVALDVCGRGG
jgi:acetylornithine deacetylase